jgi:phosphopantothenoylcysteine decarboxylase/phosphopantothenate--cysteine ligase
VERLNALPIDYRQPLKGKNILLGVCGSIAAYKAVFLLRLLQNQGAEVQVIMTNNAEKFVSSLTFSTLSQRPVFSYLWHESTGNHDWSQHVQIAQKADLIIIAPATMNTIAKLASGICDDALTATVFSASCPILIAPAMDREMYNSPQNQKNLRLLEQLGYQILPSESGFLASGLEGIGRMLEPNTIVEYVIHALTPKILQDKNILINLGPTQEAIDPVRFISNHSTGKMGIAIAKWAFRMGAKVTLIHGPLTIAVPDYLHSIPVTSALNMLEAMQNHFKDSDIIIGTAAVADFRPKHYQQQKIKKIEGSDSMFLELVKNPDILLELSKQKQSHQKLIGFALETQAEIENAKSKLKKKT